MKIRMSIKMSPKLIREAPLQFSKAIISLQVILGSLEQGLLINKEEKLLWIKTNNYNKKSFLHRLTLNNINRNARMYRLLWSHNSLIQWAKRLNKAKKNQMLVKIRLILLKQINFHYSLKLKHYNKKNSNNCQSFHQPHLRNHRSNNKHSKNLTLVLNRQLLKKYRAVLIKLVMNWWTTTFNLQ